MENLIKQKIESGYYRSPEEVVNEGLRLLNERDKAKLEELRGEIMKGYEQLRRGEGKPFDVEEIIAEGKRRQSLKNS